MGFRDSSGIIWTICKLSAARSETSTQFCSSWCTINNVKALKATKCLHTTPRKFFDSHSANCRFFVPQCTYLCWAVPGYGVVMISLRVVCDRLSVSPGSPCPGAGHRGATESQMTIHPWWLQRMEDGVERRIGGPQCYCHVDCLHRCHRHETPTFWMDYLHQRCLFFAAAETTM